MTDRHPLRPFIVDPFDYTAPSFSALLRQAVPEAMPQMGDVHNLPAHVEGTTIVATTYAGGVIIAGDRRATEVADLHEPFDALDAHWTRSGPGADVVPGLSMRWISEP